MTRITTIRLSVCLAVLLFIFVIASAALAIEPTFEAILPAESFRLTNIEDDTDESNHSDIRKSHQANRYSASMRSYHRKMLQR